MKKLIFAVIASGIFSSASAQLELAGKEGPGKGKKIVLLTGDEEYRSEESGPMLGKILSQRYGYDCTVLFSMDPTGSYIDPNNQKSVSGLEALDDADLLIVATRFRRPDEKAAQEIYEYLNEGKPVIGLRTSTHAFTGDAKTGGFQWKKFGPEILGEGWVAHHGGHKRQGARGVIVEANAKHPILNGVEDVFGPSDVYSVRRVNPDNSTILLRGSVTETLSPKSQAVEGAKNNPMMPLAWLRDYKTPDGKGKGQAFTTTMGAAVDFLSEDLRRTIVNASFFLTGVEVPAEADVTPVDPFNPTFYGFIKDKNYYQKLDLQPEDFALGKSPQVGLPDGMLPKKWTAALKDYDLGGEAPKTETASTTEAANEEDPTEAVTAVKAPADLLPMEVSKGHHITFVGNGLGDGFQRYGYFEALVHSAFPGKELVIRNLCHPGFTAGFRPHPSRQSQWAFPAAEKFNPQYAIHKGKGFYPSEDEWLSEVKTDTVLGFFGFNESFEGEEGLENFKGELAAWIDHTNQQNYNEKGAPEIFLVSPIAPESWIENAEERREQIGVYAQAMSQVAAAKGVGFIDFFKLTAKTPEAGGSSISTPYGAVPMEVGYKALSTILAKELLGIGEQDSSRVEKIRSSVMNKNWHWVNDYRMPNGVHVYGRRFKPYGPDNYPPEIKKNRLMTENRDKATWAVAQGKSFDLAAADAKTGELPPVETNYKPSKKNGSTEYLYGEDAIDALTVADGFEIEMFASEKEFDNLANPVQIAFDNRGRLWVATMPSYPHYRPGDPYPSDKILIYEDTDNDGKADKETIFVENISLPMGFELTEFGVFVSQAPHLVRMIDTDGDDKCDVREIVATGFDHHDTHHAIGAFCADPSGGIMMSEGIFLHSNVETMQGPVRGVNGGFYRYDPRRKRLERTAQVNIPNPWGVAFDEWGQDFYLHTSGTAANWMLQASAKVPYGVQNKRPIDLIPEKNRVRPTSGLEFVSSSHFPSEMQGDMLLCNNIGFLGIKQHKVEEDGTGYKLTHRQNLVVSKDGNFRPVDLEFAPDGSLYFIDWHNVLIGHMQHNQRDPLRDHVHGRIYRIRAKNRALVKPAQVDEAPIATLLDNLKLPEYRTRYRSRRELRERDADEVASALKVWVTKQGDEHALLEALWLGWGIGRIDLDLVNTLAQSKDHRVRSAVARAIRYNSADIPNAMAILKTLATDKHGRVRMEVSVAATWIGGPESLEIAKIAAKGKEDKWNESVSETAVSRLEGKASNSPEEEKVKVPGHLKGSDRKLYTIGHEIYLREGSCSTCHQPDGKGLPNAGFPPLAGSEWVNGKKNTPTRIVLHGMMGPITVNGVEYPGHVPMTALGGLYSDQEIAGVLTYVRNSFGNKATAVKPSEVKKLRAEHQWQGFWTAEALKELEKK